MKVNGRTGRTDADHQGAKPDISRIPSGDWGALGRGDIEPEIDLEELAEEEIEEDEDDDDNAYQDSDEALPDDEEEAAISRDPSRQGTRFDED
jgi:hypothetical protein